MGEVHLVRDRRTGRELALKSLSVADPTLVFSLRREIHALSRLHHPAIARIVDHGTAEGLPWYAMEIERGETLRARLDGLAPGPEHRLTRAGAPRWWTSSLPSPASSGAPLAPPSEPDAAGMERLTGLLDCFRRLCAALAYLHGEGLVHRDLKPENVILRPDGTPVLIDFGLTASFGAERGRERLSQDPTLSMGTADYVAPEQASGDWLDARADLYALGCMLHETVAGRPPFTGPIEQVLADHLRRLPPSLEERVPAVPRDLSALIERLLAKEPRERPGHADDVAAVLVGLGASADLPDDWPEPSGYLYRPALHGRDEPLAALRAGLQAARDGRGAIVLVEGESGVGKTRLLMEAARLNDTSGGQTLAGESPPPGDTGQAAEPWSALRSPLRQLASRCLGSEPGDVAALFGSGWRVLADVEPAIAGLAGLPDADEPAELPESESRLRVFSELDRLLRTASASGTLVLALDDMQWADASSLSFLRHAVTAAPFARSRLLLVATTRAEEPPAGWAELASLDSVAAIVLERLGEREVGRVVEGMLAAEPPAGLVDQVRTISEGNPFLVAEALRGALDSGVLIRRTGAGWRLHAGDAERAAVALATPEAVASFVLRRVAGLGDDALDLLQWAAIGGREVAPTLLATASGRDTGALLEPLRRLLKRQVLEETSAAQLRFAHDKIREAVLDGLDEVGRRQRHESWARALLANGAGPEQAAELAEHWEAAGCLTEARGSWETAARHALRQGSRLEGARALGRAADLTREPAARLALLGERAACLLQGGRVEEAMRVAEQGLESAVALGDAGLQADFRLTLAEGLAMTGRFRDARRPCELARDVLTETGRTEPLARAIGVLQSIEHAEGRLTRSKELAEEGLALLRALGKPSPIAETLSRLSVVHRDLGELDAARRTGEESLRLADEAGALQFAAVTRSRLAFLARQQGRPAECVRLASEALAQHRWQGNVFWEGTALGNRAVALRDLGRLEEAEAGFEESLATFGRIGESYWIHVVRGHSGLVAWDLGWLEEARARLDASIAGLDGCGDQHWAAVQRTARAGVRLDQGDLEGAADDLSGGLARLERDGDQVHEALALLTAARRALLVDGSPDEASEHAERAHVAFTRMDNALGRALAEIQRGHVGLAKGRPADDRLELVHETVQALELESDSELVRLARDLAAASASSPASLHHGHLPARLPSGLWAAIAAP